MIDQVTFHRFKQFRDQAFLLRPEGVSLVAGGNNAGKSSLLHGLAVWEFCRMAIQMERGPAYFLEGASAEKGIGLGDDEFSPINVPSLRHLWTNLKTQKRDEADGYTLKIRCEWSALDERKLLEFGLSLANDRLFVKTTESNLAEGDRIPRIAYLPPFAGITDREMRLPGAIRRRRIGEGLAGAVLRNLLLDMHTQNLDQRKVLREGKRKIRDADLRRLRENDPYELLQSTLRETFSTQLDIAEFSEEYHSYIKVEVEKGTVSGYKLKRFPNYTKRDLMVEGSGFLQWLSVYTLATDPSIDVLLLDEPDAHLHSSLQDRMLDSLKALTAKRRKQVLVATHSTEILRHAPASSILEIRSERGARYLTEEHQKVGLLAGLGSDYAPRLDRLKKTRRVLFVEGKSDTRILKIIAAKLNLPWPDVWVEWRTSSGHKERKHLFIALQAEIPGLVGVSLRDRDDEPLSTVGEGLVDLSIAGLANLHYRKWRRRHIESYFLWPPAIAAVTGQAEDEVRQFLADHHALAITDSFAQSDAPEALLDARGKLILKDGAEAILGQVNASVVEVAEAMDSASIPNDLRIFIDELLRLAE